MLNLVYFQDKKANFFLFQKEGFKNESVKILRHGPPGLGKLTIKTIKYIFNKQYRI